MSGDLKEADLNEPNLRRRAVAAARGDAPFDSLIVNGRVVDMVTGEIRAADIGIVGPLIASVHAPGLRADAAKTHDVAGAFVTPGLIDMHMHVESSMVTPATYADAVLPRGVTTIVWDPHEFGNVHGVDGVRFAADAADALALRTILLAPSCVPSAPGLEQAGADFNADVISELLGWPQIGGIAEVMNMRGVIDGDPRMSAIVQAGLDAGKPVFGHARGLSGGDLAAFVTAGVSSDHELVSGEDLLEKLRAGLAIELRGSHDHLLPAFVETINALGHLPETVTLCSDDVFPDDLLKGGGVDDVVRRLVRYGLRPEWALRAATLHAAQRLGRTDLGLVAPGRRADLAIFADLESFAARAVFVDGRCVARAGAMLSKNSPADTAALRGSMKMARVTPDQFRVRSDRQSVRLATIDRPRFTRWGESPAEVVDGFVVPPADATLIAVAHRHGQVDPADSHPRVGFLKEWGAWRGAFATTVSHDSHNLTVFGRDPADMAAAANAVIDCGGGMAVARNGQVEALLALPLSGLVSHAPLCDVARDFTAVRNAMDDIVDWAPPYLVFKACFGATLACNAGPHQTDRGIADVETGRLLASPIL
jgi:adenine deaminase